MSRTLPPLPNIDWLIDGAGEITIGAIASIPCAATASDDAQTFAMLVRRDGETFAQLLKRLDKAIGMAVEKDVFIDEINNGTDDRI
jgi:hypothetical protein